jgi:hypothetical protein
VVSYMQGQKGMNKMIVKPPTSLVMVMGRKLCQGHVTLVRWREHSGHEGRALAKEYAIGYFLNVMGIVIKPDNDTLPPYLLSEL